MQSTDPNPLPADTASSLENPALAPPPSPALATMLDHNLSQVATLVDRIESAAASKASPPTAAAAHWPTSPPAAGYTVDSLENTLAQARLGMASSLYLALRAKHAPTASHSLRVALGCSAWAVGLQMPSADREAIELAALLHDVGKIGVPDRVLLKPEKLTPEEVVLMDRYRQWTLDILSACCASPTVMELVRHASSWYDGSRPGGGPAGEQLPLGSRLITIMDAFDAMTSSQLYRSAMSHERAVQELFAFAGTQFDPRLVACFSELSDSDLTGLRQEMAAGWLRRLDPLSNESRWSCGGAALAPAPAEATPLECLYQRKLLDNMTDAVVFLDGDLQIVHRNRGAERLTGIEATAVERHHFTPALLQMRSDDGRRFEDGECPVTQALHTGAQSYTRITIRGRQGQNVTVDAQIMPVAAQDGTLLGLTLLLHDASSEMSLEKRCQQLHEKAIRDPLTQLTNRAEFDRLRSVFIEAHAQRGLPCSLIICDIDHFKRVNDTYGHPAGDDVIRGFAKLLKGSCRSGDLVARYGGEEFVMLCADCNMGTAFERADQIRRAWAAVTHPQLEGDTVTASFGVTETQTGDTAETLLQRADRALLNAKQNGRNVVVQLGSGQRESPPAPRAGRWWPRFWQPSRAEALLEENLITSVPFNVAIEKLRGFVADHGAVIDAIESDQIRMSIAVQSGGPLRRKGDRQVPLLVELKFAEEKIRGPGAAGITGGAVTQTKIRVVMRPRRARDRRRIDATNWARHLLASLRSYLMASDDPGGSSQDVLRRTTHMLIPWTLNKPGDRANRRDDR